MQNTFEYISINEIISRLTRHPLLLSVNKEAAIQYVVDFIGIFGLPLMYEVREDIVDIDKFRGIIPCPVISINGVRKLPEDIALRAITEVFDPAKGPRCHNHRELFTYKVLNRIIFTGFEFGRILINYNTIHTDADGFPMLLDDPLYLSALEAYIKKLIFTIKFDMMEISLLALLNALLEYAWAAGRLNSAYKIPSYDEMESIKNEWCTLIQRTTEHRNNFRELGTPEFIRNH